MLMNPRRIYAAFAIFLKRIFLKIIFGITVKCVAILLIFIVTDEKLILYQYIIITKNYV